MVKKIALFFIILSTFIFIFFFKKCKKQGNERLIEDKEKLINNVMFTGIVEDVILSSNHGFGIVKLRVLESSITKKCKADLDQYFPYHIEEGKAELYSVVSSIEETGDTIKVDSNNLNFYYSIDGKEKKGELFMIRGKLAKDFIDLHTELKCE